MKTKRHSTPLVQRSYEAERITCTKVHVRDRFSRVIPRNGRSRFARSTRPGVRRTSPKTTYARDQRALRGWNVSRSRHLAIDVPSGRGSNASRRTNSTTTFLSLLRRSCCRRPAPGHARAACRPVSFLDGNRHPAHNSLRMHTRRVYSASAHLPLSAGHPDAASPGVSYSTPRSRLAPSFRLRFASTIRSCGTPRRKITAARRNGAFLVGLTVRVSPVLLFFFPRSRLPRVPKIQVTDPWTRIVYERAAEGSLR